MAHPFVHVELTTTDIGKAKSFYQSLFHWELNDVEVAPGRTYTMIGVGEGTGGGMMQAPGPGMPSAWLPYVLVDDIVATTEKAKSLGAEVCLDVMEVMDMGRLSIISDPTGAMLGFWQPKSK
jgi:predicted enzyme related to lactoylglutathione lyase